MNRIMPKLVSGPGRRGPRKGQGRSASGMAKLRVSRGMTQAKVGERLGISCKMVGDIEQGLKLPSDTVIEKLFQLYGVKLENMRYLCGLAFANGRMNVRNRARLIKP